MKTYKYYNKLAKQEHEKYPWKRLLRTISYRCNNTNNKDYKNYGGRGIKCNITEDELKELWFRDKAYEMEKPTIDRIDNNGHYTYDNCQFLENEDNVKKAHSKNIIQYDMNGEYIKEWISQSEASRQLNISQGNIGSCCRGERLQAGGYKWSF